MSPADKLLPHLDATKRTGPGRWIARCPAHDDRTPSLSMKEVEDGRLLLRCWAGCSAADVVAALGLNLSDLFPPRAGAAGAGHAPLRRPWSAGELIELAAFEAGVAVVVCSDVLTGMSTPDWDRLIAAASRLADMQEVVRGSR